jgi:hypothetical protein
MSSNFQIALKKKKDNLHLQAEGDFDGSSAWQLINLLHEEYNGKGEVLIDTGNLRRVYPFGCRTFQCQLDLNRVPATRLSFKGEKGFEIAPRGSKVIEAPKRHRCRCDGKCTNCPCSEEKKKD